jgi:hypothetical protein
MNDRYGDNRDSRWRDQGGRLEDRGYGSREGGRNDRGFMERAGDEARSWFGGSDHERGRQDEGRWERERGTVRSNQDDNYAHAGYQGTAGGWGNQSGDSWNRDRPGTSGSHGAYGASDYQPSQSGHGRDERSSHDRGRGGSSGSGDRLQPSSAGDGGGMGADIWGGSGFGGSDDNGRRFDRVDAGHVGSHGAHPMSAPTGGGFATGTGISAGGGYSSSARYYAAQRQGSGRQSGQQQPRMGGGAAVSRHQHDPHYHEWRSRQVESLDRDYDEYRREHQSRFEQDFSNWRTRRTEQRQSMGRVTEHMEVIGSDGEKIGVVDKVAGDRIVLTRNEENAGGHHHSIPCSWIEKVEDKVTVNKTREEAMREWRDEENNRALFERERQQSGGSDGPHVLNRSFSGTY